jgi:hypothetical protein
MTDSKRKYPEIEFDFEADLHIDKNNLDEEIVAQPNMMMKYSVFHAQAQLDRDRAKQNLDQTKARLNHSIREAAKEAGEKFGAGGVTDSVVDARIRQHPDYIEARDRYDKAEYKVNVLFGGVMAMNARRPLLEELVRLYLNGYWSTPRPQGDFGSQASQVDTEAAIMRGREAAMGPEPVISPAERAYVEESIKNLERPQPTPKQAGPEVAKPTPRRLPAAPTPRKK